MAVTKNFGSIVALIKKSTPPTTTSVIWYDTTQVTAADSFKVYDNNTSSWVKLIDVINASANGTDLSITPNASNISLNSSTGDDVVLPASTGTNAGLMTSAQFSKLLGIEANAKDDQAASEVPVIAISGVTGANVQAVLEDLKSQINSAGGVTNLGISLDVNSVTVTSDTGTDAQILAASALQAGVMTAANFTKLSGIQSGAEVNKAISLGTAGTDIFAGKSSDTLQIRKLSVGGNMSIATQPGGEIFIDALSGNATVVQPAQSFATDGVETDFTLVTADANPVIYLVEVGGVAQVSGYTISGLTVSFDVAPANGTTVGIHFFTDVSIATLQARLPDFAPNEEYGQDAAIKNNGTIRVLKSSITVPYSSATFVEADWDTIGGTSPANTIKGNDTGAETPTKDLTISEVIAMLDAIVSGNNGNKAIGLEPGTSAYDLFEGLFRVYHASNSTTLELNGGDFKVNSDEGGVRKKIIVDSSAAQQIRLEIRNKTTDALIHSLILDANGLRRGVASTGTDPLEVIDRGSISQVNLNSYPGAAPAAIPITTSTTINEAISILEKATILNSAVGTKVGTKFTDDFNRASLGSEYTIVGSFATAAIAGNKLRLEHLGAPDWSRYVYRNDFPSSDLLSTIEADIDLVDITPANAGIGIRLHGYNSGRDYSCRIFTNSAPGQLHIQFDNGSAGQVESKAHLAITQGDSLTLKVSVYKNSMFFKATNNTTNKSVFAQRDFPVDLNEVYRQPNRWQQGIQMFAGIYDITRLEYNSDQRLFADICFVGDSLTVGYNNIDYFDVWRLQVANELNRTHATIAGGGNTTQDILDILYEIIAIQPSNVVIMIGQNDVNQAVALATIQANITSIVDQLEAEGINVILLANVPNGNTDQKDLADWILSTYPSQSVDLYYPFLQTTSTIIAEVSYINSSHWTPLGNDIVAKILTDELPSLLV